MSQRQSLAEIALFKRGFLIIPMNHGFRLSKGSHENDHKDLIKIFNENEIEYDINLDVFTVKEEISDRQYLNILHYPARNHESNAPAYLSSWKSFIRRKHGLKIRTLTLESGVAILVKSLNAVGLSTICSCDGHGVKKPVIHFASFPNGVWFEYLQRKFLKDLPLHYKWTVDVSKVGIAYLSAVGRGYSVNLLQDDCDRMSRTLLSMDEEIRQLKLVLFGIDKKYTKRLLKGKSYQSTKKLLMEIISDTETR